MNPMSKVASAFVGLLLVGAAGFGVQPAGSMPADAEIRELLAERIDDQKRSVGIVVGVIAAGERRVVSYGRLTADDPREPDGDTVYEIGSITKVFTAILLADLAEEGAVKLETPVQRLLGPDVTMPTRTAGHRPQRAAQTGGELGPPDPRRRRGFALDGERYVDLRRGESRPRRVPAACLDGCYPRSAIEVDPAIYDAYVGRYQLVENLVFTVTRQGDRLFVQLTGQPRFEVFPESETQFFLRVVDAQITFGRAEDGSVDQLVLHQNGVDQPAGRLAE